MYVLIDHHPKDYNGKGDEVTSYNLPLYVDRWAWVWRWLMSKSYYASELRGRVMIDIMNEPDAIGQGWQAKVGA